MTNYNNESLLTDEIVDAATRASWEYMSYAPYTDRDVRIVRQAKRVTIAAALHAGLEDKIRADERQRIAEAAEGHHFMEAAGGYIECSCGWPSQEQFKSGEHEVQHVLAAKEAK